MIKKHKFKNSGMKSNISFPGNQILSRGVVFGERFKDRSSKEEQLALPHLVEGRTKSHDW
jgi:hypothetical protein